MKWFPLLACALLFFTFSLAPTLVAQTGNPYQLTPEQQKSQDAAAAAAATGCFACGTGAIVFLVVMFVLNIAILIWVARDAKSRGMDSSVVWMILVFFTHFIGLIIYLFSRPKGELIPCPHCQNKRLRVSAKCPNCGNA